MRLEPGRRARDLGVPGMRGRLSGPARDHRPPDGGGRLPLRTARTGTTPGGSTPTSTGSTSGGCSTATSTSRPRSRPHLRRRQIAHILTAPDRVRGWLDALGLPEGAGPLLDLGCGSGSFLSSVGGSGREVAGVDIALRWLIVARKRLDEEGLGHVPLACGCAERLPFADRGFAGVVAGDVIEHVADQAATLAEAHRVLRPGGRLFLASPNRFSLAPEPHVQVWGVGFLPRAWMAGYVRAVSGRRLPGDPDARPRRMAASAPA